MGSGGSGGTALPPSVPFPSLDRGAWRLQRPTANHERSFDCAAHGYISPNVEGKDSMYISFGGLILLILILILIF